MIVGRPVKKSRKISLKKERKHPLKLLKFPPAASVKKFFLVCLFFAALAQAFLLFYFYSLHTREYQAINEYKEALRFILREGGGFNYSICNQYITPDDPQIVSLAKSLQTPENAFNFIVTRIGYRFEVTEDLLYPFIILNRGYSNCVGQANLLASLLIALGNPEKNVWVVYGSIVLNKKRGNHAWVEFKYNGQWSVLDPTLLTPYKGFAKYERYKFYSDFKIVPVIRYNNRTKYFVSY